MLLDVPRAFLAEHAGGLFFFGCAFDEQLDDYRDHYRVFRLNGDIEFFASVGSWTHFAQAGSFVGSVRVGHVRFDHTRRTMVDDQAFDQLGPE